MTPAPYTLTVEAKRQSDDPDGTRRLRHLLKRMLRSYGLRCISMAPSADGDVIRPASPIRSE